MMRNLDCTMTTTLDITTTRSVSICTYMYECFFLLYSYTVYVLFCHFHKSIFEQNDLWQLLGNVFFLDLEIFNNQSQQITNIRTLCNCLCERQFWKALDAPSFSKCAFSKNPPPLNDVVIV